MNTNAARPFGCVVKSRTRMCHVLLIPCVVAFLGGDPLAEAQEAPSRPPEKPGPSDQGSDAEQVDEPWGGMVIDKEQRERATREANDILETAIEYDHGGGVYPESFVQRLLDFYQYGVGAKDNPGDPVVTRKICREIVLALTWDLLLVTVSYDGSPVPGTFQNPLNKTSTERFHRLLLEILDTADTDLSLMQRVRLFRIVSLVFDRGDEEACAALERLAERDDCGPGELALIKYNLGKLECVP